MKSAYAFASSAILVSAFLVGCSNELGDEESATSVNEALSAPFAFQKTAQWSGGFNAQVTITNTTNTELHGWQFRMDFPVSVRVVSASVPFSRFATPGIDNRWVFTSENGILAPGASVTVYLTATTTVATGDHPSNCTLNDVRVTCDGSSDLTPPSSPGPVTFSYVGPSIVAGSFGPATDDVGVVAYRLRRLFYGAKAPIEWSETSSNSFRMANAGGRYILLVAAIDAAGNVGPEVASELITTPPHPVRMVFHKTNVWPGGYNAQITLENRSPDQVSNWTATFELPGVQNVWGADWTPGSNGTTQFVTAPSYNPTLAGGAGGILLGLTASGDAVPTSCGFFGGTCELVVQ